MPDKMKTCARCGRTMKESEAERVGLVVYCPGCAQDYRDDAEIEGLLAHHGQRLC